MGKREGLGCLFCGSTTAKRSREHIFRRAFKDSFPSVESLSFARQSSFGLEKETWKTSQFDLTINQVCRECNQGWLNDLESLVEPSLIRLRDGAQLSLTIAEVQDLALWAYIRALLVTQLHPQASAPHSFYTTVFRDRRVAKSAYVQLGFSAQPVYEAGCQQSARLHPGNEYYAYVAFGLGNLVFLVSICSSQGELSQLSREVIRAPRLWFPGSFMWLSPPERIDVPLSTLTREQALTSCLSFVLLNGGLEPIEQTGRRVNARAVIPEKFHSKLGFLLQKGMKVS